MEVKRERWVFILAVILGVFTVNLLASRHFFRMDLTAQNVYTLASATKNILKSLDDVVTIRLYFTPELPPALTALRRDVEDILLEFKTHAKNRIHLEYHNPQETPIKEQQIQLMGIPPVEVNVIQKDKQEVAKIYLGATVNFGPKQEVLAVIQNTSNLEYRLSAGIVKVTQAKKPIMGWFGPSIQENLSDTETKREGYEMAMERLKQRYEVRTVSELGSMDNGPSTLLFVVPEKLTAEEKKAFENYLTGGGKAIVLIDRVSLGQGLRSTLHPNPLEDFLKSYGVEVKPNLVLDRSNAMATFSGGIISYHIPYPFWVLIRPEGFNREQPMVSELGSLVLPWASSISLDANLPEGVTATTLFKTTQFGVTSTPQETTPLDPQETSRALNEGAPSIIPLGVMIDNKLLVIGNSKFIQNSFLQQFEENGIFLENAVDIFSTGEALVGIRSKGIINQPIAIVSDAARTWIKVVDILISPILLLGLGFFIVYWRKTKAKTLQSLMANPV